MSCEMKIPSGGLPPYYDRNDYSNYLSKCAETNTAADSIVAQLTDDPDLQSLSMTHQSHSIGDVTTAIKELDQNPSPIHLNLSYNWFGSEIARPIAEVLAQNTTVKILDLSYNGLNDEDAGLIAEAIKTNTCLMVLNLKGNAITAKGAALLADALRTNSSLLSLDLSINHLYIEGVAAFKEPLRENSRLINLRLNDNFGRFHSQLDARCLGELLSIQSLLERNQAMS